MNSQDKKYLIPLGMALGLGLLTKYTILVWAFGLCIGFIFYQKGNLFKNKWLYISALISFLIFLPNVIWQAQNNFPLLKHLQALSANQLEEISPMDFGLEQLNFPFTLMVSLLVWSPFLWIKT